MCKRKPSEVADIPDVGVPVGDVRVLGDKRSTNRMLQASRELAFAPVRGRIGEFKLAECLDKTWGRTEVRQRPVAGRQ